ncbi:MAG: hypothetical protein RBS77_05155 [Candidatus Moranbacteria bacterium]|nr:hypothetical protein [Candidatus Moranbacteria bacterium]
MESKIFSPKFFLRYATEKLRICLTLSEIKLTLYNMENFEQLKSEIETIKNRNKKVESDKAWETSVSRKVLIAILTYFVIVLFFFIANLANPFVNAIVPTIGFVLSTLSISIFKQFWIKHIYHDKNEG